MNAELDRNNTDQTPDSLIPPESFLRPPDEILDSLVHVLIITMSHPDVEVQALAQATLTEVHIIQEAARQRLAAAQQREVTFDDLEGLPLLIEHIAYELHADASLLPAFTRQ